MGQLAARVSDLHACVHGPGTIVPPGEPMVLEGGLPSARVTDQCTCAIGLGPITQGAAMVLIGGLPAARMGDATIHGGVIALGFPLILIGGPTFSVPASIKITGDATFQAKVVRDLYHIWRTPTGKALLESIDKSGQISSVQNISLWKATDYSPIR